MYSSLLLHEREIPSSSDSETTVYALRLTINYTLFSIVCNFHRYIPIIFLFPVKLQLISGQRFSSVVNRSLLIDVSLVSLHKQTHLALNSTFLLEYNHNLYPVIASNEVEPLQTLFG